MNEEKIINVLFEKENEEIFKKHFDREDAIVIYDYNFYPNTWEGDGQYIDDIIWGEDPLFAPLRHSKLIGCKWIAKYKFAECLKTYNNEVIQRAIQKATHADIVIATPEMLEEILAEDIKIKIIKELL